MTELQAQTQPAATAAKPAKPPKEQQNSVTRPKSGTKTARVWEISDALSQAAGKPAARADVLKAAVAESINEATAATQYGRWCKYHGIKAERTPKAPKAEKPAEAAPAAAAVSAEAQPQVAASA